MVKREPTRRLRVVKGLAPDPLSTADLEVAEATLARLVALAYRADHPDLFNVHQNGADASQMFQPFEHDVAGQPVGAETAAKKVLKCGPRGEMGDERTAARPA